MLGVIVASCCLKKKLRGIMVVATGLAWSPVGWWLLLVGLAGAAPTWFIFYVLAIFFFGLANM